MLVLVSCAWRPRARQRSQTRHHERVFNGVDVKNGIYTYVVILLFMSERTCTGTLIAAEWVVTAAHCNVDSVQYGNMTSRPHLVTAISQLLKRIPHPNYQHVRVNDLAMLLVEEICLDRYGALSAIDYGSMLGLKVLWIGGGLTTWSWNASNVIADYMRPLQQGTGALIRCGQYDESIGPHMCVAGPCSSQQHVMPADSGGPLFVADKIVGVAYTLHYTRKTSVFTAISPYSNWIAIVMKDNGRF